MLVSWKSTDEEKRRVSAPSSDPLLHEVVPSSVTPALYQVPSTGLTRKQHDQAMKETLRVLEGCHESYLGFAGNLSFSVPALFQSPFTNVMMNHGGDPFLTGSILSFQAKWIERNVLNYYASLWNAKWPHDPADPLSYWGYVLTMGSTEGNMHALWSSKNYLSGVYVDKLAVNGEDPARNVLTTAPSKEPVVFFSQNSNSSLPKLCNLVSAPTFDAIGKEQYPGENPLGGPWEQGVPCEGGDAGPGTIDVSALEKLVDFFSSRGHPIVMIFNYGTTLKGVCDNVEYAGNRLMEILRRNGMYERQQISPENPSKRMIRKGFWIHIDGVFSATYMPFLEMAYKSGLTDIKPASAFDFKLDFVSSIVMSGHKFIGTPWPCGVYLVRNSEQVSTWSFLYNGSFDTTIALSRNGHSSFLLWSFISTNSYDCQVAMVLECLCVVKYAVKEFKTLQLKLGMDLMIFNDSPSLSVVFRRPKAHIVEKYTLSCSTLHIESSLWQVSQIYIMPHVTTAKSMLSYPI